MLWKSVVFVGTIIGIILAQDQFQFSNAVGWNAGLSYRRYVGKACWIGARVNYDLQSQIQQDTTNSVYHSISADGKSDSIVNNTTISKDSTNYYTGTVTIEFGKELFRHKMISVDAVISEGYSYSNTRQNRGGSNSYFSSDPRHSFITSLGLEPKAWIFKRFSLGTDFGVQYIYKFGKDLSSDSYGSTTQTDFRATQGKFSSNEFKTFGNISLSMTLNAYFYF
jgi:hypothetical protein